MAVKEQIRRLKQREHMAKALFTTNLAWRVEIITPTPELNALLVERARKPGLAMGMLPLIQALRAAIPAGDPRLDEMIYYTCWGKERLEALVAPLTISRRFRG